MDILLNWLWQGTALALATALVLRVLRGLSATLKCHLLWLALLLILILPLALIPGLTSNPASGVPSEVAAGDEPGPPIAIGPVSARVVLTLAALAVVWSVLLTSQASLALVGLHRLKRRCRPFPHAREAALAHWNEVKAHGRRARLVISDNVSSAAVLGIWSPVIAVGPSLLARLSDGDLDRVVIHEWAHVQRRDDVTNLLQVVTRALVGWHPGVWWIDRQLHMEREAACDERAILLTGSPRDYAACLTRLAEMRGSTSAALLAPGAAHASHLTGRIERVLARKTLPSLVTSATTGTLAMVVLTGLAISLSGVSLIAMRPVGGLATVTATLAGAMSTIGNHMESTDRDAPTAPAAARRRGGRDRFAAPAPGTARRGVATSADAPLIVADPSVSKTAGQPAAPDVRRSPPLPESAALASLSSAPGEELPKPTGVTDPGKQREATPWSAAADSGVAVARGSQRAAVATAGFFSRLGKKVAKSF